MGDLGRKPQLAYSEIQDKTREATRRKQKALKIVAVLEHFLGREDLTDLVCVDVGCSTGYTANALRVAGGRVLGLDIDGPGLADARSQFGAGASFVCADGVALPLPDRSVDVLVFNHIYEHVVDPDAVLAEIRRVLKFDGVAYLGFGNRLQVMEPHYRLPFLSWLPRGLAHRYVAWRGDVDEYYEKFRTRRHLKQMCAPLRLWDYTYTILADPAAFAATDMVPRALLSIPPWGWRAGAAIMPTYIWIGTLGARGPGGQPTRSAPRLLRGTS